MEVNTWFATGSSRAPSFVNLCWQVAWVNWRAVLGAWYCSQRKALSRSAALADFECFWYSEYLRVFAAVFVGAKICAILWFWTAHDRYPTLGDNHGASWIDACWPNCVWQDRGGKCSFLSHDTIGRVRNVYTVVVFLEVLAAALGAVADGENYLPVPCSCWGFVCWPVVSFFPWWTVDHVSLARCRSTRSTPSFRLGKCPVTLNSYHELTSSLAIRILGSFCAMLRSIKQGQLYGENDEGTQEWTVGYSCSGQSWSTSLWAMSSCIAMAVRSSWSPGPSLAHLPQDGILALTVRYASSAEQTKRQWILLDGPVDADIALATATGWS